MTPPYFTRPRFTYSLASLLACSCGDHSQKPHFFAHLPACVLSNLHALLSLDHPLRHSPHLLSKPCSMPARALDLTSTLSLTRPDSLLSRHTLTCSISFLVSLYSQHSQLDSPSIAHTLTTIFALAYTSFALASLAHAPRYLPAFVLLARSLTPLRFLSARSRRPCSHFTRSHVGTQTLTLLLSLANLLLFSSLVTHTSTHSSLHPRYTCLLSLPVSVSLTIRFRIAPACSLSHYCLVVLTLDHPLSRSPYLLPQPCLTRFVLARYRYLAHLLPHSTSSSLLAPACLIKWSNSLCLHKHT